MKRIFRDTKKPELGYTYEFENRPTFPRVRMP